LIDTSSVPLAKPGTNTKQLMNGPYTCPYLIKYHLKLFEIRRVTDLLNI